MNTKETAVERHHRKQERELSTLVKTIASDYPNEYETIVEMTYRNEADLESKNMHIQKLKDLIRSLSLRGEQKALLDAKTVTALIAKRKTAGAYDRTLSRYVENMEREYLLFLREVGLDVEE
jgi:uncharacterized protein YqfB (UPF0267 family)